jgi:hypothetical protein
MRYRTTTKQHSDHLTCGTQPTPAQAEPTRWPVVLMSAAGGTSRQKEGRMTAAETS